MRIPNSFLTDYCSTATEFKTACFFYSLVNPTTKTSSDGNYIIRVKQSTLAKVTGSSLSTVRRTIKRLEVHGFIITKTRSCKSDGELGTYDYIIKKITTHRDYFHLSKIAFNQLEGKSLIVYATFCKLASGKTLSFFQSYKELSDIIGFSRSEIMFFISLLEKNKFIRKYMRLTSYGDYTDNTYYIIPCVRGKIRKKAINFATYNYKKIIKQVFKKVNRFFKKIKDKLLCCVNFKH